MSLVHIVHDEIKTLGGPVSRRALERLWSKKGWREATPDEVVSHTAERKAAHDAAMSLTAEDLASIRKRSQLDAIALERGIDPTQHDNMESLRDAVAATLG